jgi:hypothetical protein
MKRKVVLLDAAQVSAIVKYSGLEGLNAVANRDEGSLFY